MNELLLNDFMYAFGCTREDAVQMVQRVSNNINLED